MTDEKRVTVRVLPERSLSLNGEGGSTNYVAGDELELAAGDAKQLIADGFVATIRSRP
jgi:hypothetical protein